MDKADNNTLANTGANPDKYAKGGLVSNSDFAAMQGNSNYAPINIGYELPDDQIKTIIDAIADSVKK